MIWTPSSDRKTVVRAAAGRFFRPHGLTSAMDAERVALGPPGLGRQLVPGSAILNPLPGIPGVPVGTPLDFRSRPTLFTGADLMAILPAIRAGNPRASPTPIGRCSRFRSPSSRRAPNTAIFPADVPNPSAVHVNAGLQRELAPGMVLSADVVYRHFARRAAERRIDRREPLQQRSRSGHPRVRAGPSRPTPEPCAHAERSTSTSRRIVSPTRGCCFAPRSGSRSGWQILGSYAYSRNAGTNAGNGFNLDNWLQNTGPVPTDFTHVVNVAGVTRLP